MAFAWMLQNVRVLTASRYEADPRIDIPTADIKNILSRLSKVVYITQEVIFGSGEPVTPSEYTQNGM